MSPITRAWIAFAAVGAGLVHLALAVSAPALLAVLLAVVGIAEFGWGVMVTFDERFLAPRVAVIAVLAPIGLWIAALAFGLDVRPLPLALATLLELFIAFAIGLSLRRARAPKPVGTARYVVGLAIAALVIAAVTAPALAATEAGERAIDPSLFEDGTHH